MNIEGLLFLMGANIVIKTNKIRDKIKLEKLYFATKPLYSYNGEII
jgi:hypothetical protein